MLKYLKIGTSALAVSALFLAPAVTVTFVTADSAYAKNGNGNGNGNGGGGGNRGGGKGGKGGGASKGGDKGGDKGAKGKSAKSKASKHKGSKGKSASKGGFGKGLKDFGSAFKKDVGKLLGAKPKNTVKASKPAKAHAAKEKGVMHPSNLGKLNGAINSSPRAKEAHIANGQYAKGTGPVSLAAALAVADYNYDDVNMSLEAFNEATETLELAAAFALVDNKPTEAEVDAAEKQIADANQEIADAEAVLSDPDASDAEKEDAQAAKEMAEADKLAAEAVTGYPDTTEAEAKIEGQERPENVDEAVETVEAGPPSEEDIQSAEQAVVDAQDALLAAYKGDLASFDDVDETTPEDGASIDTTESSPEDGLTPQEKEVLDAVRMSNPAPETVGEALDSYEEKMGTEEDGEVAEGEDGDMTEEDPESAMVEDTETIEES